MYMLENSVVPIILWCAKTLSRVVSIYTCKEMKCIDVKVFSYWTACVNMDTVQAIGHLYRQVWTLQVIGHLLIWTLSKLLDMVEVDTVMATFCYLLLSNISSFYHVH